MSKEYYAVINGYNPGLYDSWDDCQENVSGYRDAIYRGFNNRYDALEYLGCLGDDIPDYTNYLHDDDDDGPNFNIHWIFTDGACKNNQDRGRAYGGYGVYLPFCNFESIAAPLNGKNQTNQRAELMGIMAALKVILHSTFENKHNIATDSGYAINCFKHWARKWQQNDWCTSAGTKVSNRDIIEPSLRMIARINDLNDDNDFGDIEICYIPGHSGNPGNENADRLANMGCRMNIP